MLRLLVTPQTCSDLNCWPVGLSGTAQPTWWMACRQQHRRHMQQQDPTCRRAGGGMGGEGEGPQPRIPRPLSSCWPRLSNERAARPPAPLGRRGQRDPTLCSGALCSASASATAGRPALQSFLLRHCRHSIHAPSAPPPCGLESHASDRAPTSVCLPRTPFLPGPAARSRCAQHCLQAAAGFAALRGEPGAPPGLPWTASRKPLNRAPLPSATCRFPLS